ncbi:ABC transporter ATP-binding protein [Rhizobium leguminosarum]|jgi:oligopeptide/dipeptide ABC transporter ATP-binding protein|uniref:ABC transporter ATP-binding protein n=1 Tax=Rhizobium leguminosarum TaxID=384 RepID=UPI001C944250|nr:ABC transporter ATP-binding protein [Rhizobium leguminosarum]MBY5827143.1 ABC transporter ATP-binding protein [Rhizobium leguminosarum]
MTDAPLLDISGLRIAIADGRREHVAVENIDLEVSRGEILGLVGESGSGKSISMLSVMGLAPSTMRISGSIMFDGKEILGLPERHARKLRGRRIAMIFQNPMTALNPVLSIGRQIVEALMLHNPFWSSKQLRMRAIELLELVAIALPEKRFSQFPHELSGGMCQRVVIAIAVANDPDLLIADEPTTALDVTIQAQIVDLLNTLRREKNLAIVLITHDLGLVAGLADRVAILYSGRIAERGEVDDVFSVPRHPYTAGLLAAIPAINTDRSRLHVIDGTPPSIRARPPGCQFQPRCPISIPICKDRTPEFRWHGASMVACHRSAEVELIKGAVNDS